uniref:Venom peptide ECTX1-Rm16a n=1 Tax=Rhytidoponera metallica TaxID=148364 RepID=A0A8U0LTP7_RHYMT|nr:venom peptide precursor ECTX1-Rm16a [Rhytidoponera metallica]
MKRIYFLFAIIAVVVLTTQAFSNADAEAEAWNMEEELKKMIPKEIYEKALNKQNELMACVKNVMKI